MNETNRVELGPEDRSRIRRLTEEACLVVLSDDTSWVEIPCQS